MSIERFYTETITVYRMVYTLNKAALVEQGTITGHIQQAGADLIASVAETYKLSHFIWCARSENVQVGDELTVGGDKYTVAAVQDNTTGMNTHYELHVMKA